MKFPLFWWPLSHFVRIGLEFFRVKVSKKLDSNYETEFLKSSLHIRLMAHLIHESSDKQLTPKKKPITPPVSLYQVLTALSQPRFRAPSSKQ